jgi:3-phosphoshikimate 1-carboxyvinyltransferase
MIKFNKQITGINGEVSQYGDQELSYYSLLLGGLADGITRITNIAKTDNVVVFIDILKSLGISIIEDKGIIVVTGNNKKINEPINVIDIKRNSLFLFLLVGVLSNYNFKFFLKSDDYLTDIDIAELISAYTDLNVKFYCRNNINLPLLMIGNNIKKNINYEYTNYHSLIKNSLLLTSIISNTKNNVIIENERRNNTFELIMKYFDIKYEEHDIGTTSTLSSKIGKEIIIDGGQSWKGKDITIPTDTFFASCIATLVILVPNSLVTIKGVLLNPYKEAFFRTLIDLGADITFTGQRILQNEKLTDIIIRYKKLKDFIISADRTNKLLEEYYFLILIAIVSGINLSIQNINFIKERDREYNKIVELLRNLDVDFLDKNNILTIKSKIKKTDIKIDTSNIINPNFLLMLSFIGLFNDESVEVDNSILEKSFYDIKNILFQLGVNVN